MRYLLLILFFALQTFGYGANAIDLQKNDVENVLTSNKSSEEKRSYDRFRYYSPDTGTYISQDPIGLAGNNPNLYAYVHDNNSWVDVFGLSKFNPIEVLGRKVYQNSADFVTGTPDFVDSSVDKHIRKRIAKRVTNLDLMKTGNAPIGIDGKQINLHHVIGQEPGSMVELTSSFHKKHHKALHGLIVNGRSFRNNKALHNDYESFRKKYWKERAKGLSCH